LIDIFLVENLEGEELLCVVVYLEDGYVVFVLGDFQTSAKIAYVNTKNIKVLFLVRILEVDIKFFERILTQLY